MLDIETSHPLKRKVSSDRVTKGNYTPNSTWVLTPNLPSPLVRLCENGKDRLAGEGTMLLCAVNLMKMLLQGKDFPINLSLLPLLKLSSLLALRFLICPDGRNHFVLGTPRHFMASLWCRHHSERWQLKVSPCPSNVKCLWGRDPCRLISAPSLPWEPADSRPRALSLEERAYQQHLLWGRVRHCASETSSQPLSAAPHGSPPWETALRTRDSTR